MMYLFIVLKLTNILLVIATSRSIVAAELIPISDYDEATQLSLAHCIAKASEIHFKQFEVITISLSPTVDHVHTTFSDSCPLDAMLLPELFRKSKWTFLVKQPSLGRPTWYKRFNYLTVSKSSSYVLHLQSWTEMKIHLTFLKQHPSWNPHAKFIVISARLYENVKHILEKIVRKLWRCDILNGVILIPTQKNPSIFNVYSWFPFANGRCGDKFNKISAIDSCMDGEMATNTEWFPNKLPAKLNNCTVHVRTLDYPPYIVNPQRIGNTSFYSINKGLEAQILNMVADTSNSYMRYEIVENDSWGDLRWPANESTGLVGALARDEADVAVAALSATWERYRYLDFTTAYFQDSLGFCVPHADETSQLEKMSGIMSPEIYLGVFIILLAVSFLTTSLSRHQWNSEERPAYKNHASVLQKTLSIFFGCAITLQPRTTQVRLFLMLWIIFSLHLNTVYLTNLVRVLTSVEYSYQIQSVDDIVSSSLEVLFLPDNKKYFNASAMSQQAKMIVTRWADCKDIDECIWRTAYRRDSVFAASRLYMQYAKNNYISNTGLPLLYCLQEKIVSYPVVTYMRHGFPLRYKFDDIINRINSAGYIHKFANELFEEKNVDYAFKNSNSTEYDFLDVDMKKILKFEHIKPIFMVLIGGYIISLSTFCLEMTYYRYGQTIAAWFNV